MLILRLKRCERALAGGRLDEAAKLVGAADARAHRRGQELLDQLVSALTARAREHLTAGRLSPAEADWHEAARLAGNLPALAELRGDLDRAIDDRRRAADRQRGTAAIVNQMVKNGQLTLAQQAVADNAERDGRVGALAADLGVHRAALERVEADVATAMSLDDWEAAVQHLANAGTAISGGNGRLLRLARQVGQRVAEEVGRLVDAGRLDAADRVIHRALPLCATHGELDGLRRGIEQCAVAWGHVKATRYRDAHEILERISTLWPQAAWIKGAIAELHRACESVEAVRGGPLGVLEMNDRTVSLAAFPHVPHRAAKTTPTPVPTPAARIGPSARRFLLHVDGAGSFVVLQGGTIHVGPISSSRPVDLPLITGAGAPALTLARSDEDYFMTAAGPVLVNDRPTSSKLLASGDRIGVGPRCRLEFRRPNAASGSAVLRVNGARLPWGGVDEALLMDREIILGDSAAAHVRVRECPGAVILQATQDGLLCRADDTLSIDGRPAGRAAPVPDGARVVVGSLSFVVCRE